MSYLGRAGVQTARNGSWELWCQVERDSRKDDICDTDNHLRSYITKRLTKKKKRKMKFRTVQRALAAKWKRSLKGNPTGRNETN